MLSPVAAFVLGCLLLLGALIGLATASLVLGFGLLAASAAVFVLFFGAAERDRSSSVARGALAARDRVRGWTSFITGSASAWTTAGREVVRLRGELKALRGEREQLLLALGEAAFREDAAAAASLRARIREIDGKLDSREQTRVAVLAGARNRVADERLAVRHTEVLPPVEAERSRGTTDA